MNRNISKLSSEELMNLKAERLGGGIGDDNGLSWTCNYCLVVGEQESVISQKDKIILRELANKVAFIAADPEQDVKRKLWKDHNGLKLTRPLIFCDPETAWYEIIPSTELRCQGKLARIWEFRLLKEIYWAENIKDDRVIQNIFTVHYVYSQSDRGLDSKKIGGAHDGAFNWESALNDYAELDKLHFRNITVDYEKTEAIYNLASEVFEGVLEVKLEGSWWWSMGMTSDLIVLRGFEQTLFDMYDYPDELHKLMSFLRDENLSKLDFLERNGLLSLNNGGDFVGTGGYGWTNELPSSNYNAKHVTPMDMWGYCESQETINVSPEFFKEFVFPYQLPIMERFGLNIYGCCEPLDNRWDIIKNIPRLRRVTVSPWSNPDIMAENLGKNYVFVRKINPSFVATNELYEEEARAEIKQTFEAAYRNSCPAEILLRDLVTVSWNPQNVIRWTQIAREESERIYK